MSNLRLYFQLNMLKRYLVYVSASIFVMFSGSLSAQEQGSVLEMRKLQAILSVINAELRSDLDQILILQEAIKANARMTMEVQGRSPDPVSYDDVAVAQRFAIKREMDLNAQFDAVIAQSAALRAKKQAYVERVMEIGVAPYTSAEKISSSRSE
jgi:hypothetical protein